jgi:hypothetical protein
MRGPDVHFGSNLNGRLGWKADIGPRDRAPTPLSENGKLVSESVNAANGVGPRLCLSREGFAVVDRAFQVGLDFSASLPAHYGRREKHHRTLANAAYREWKEHLLLAERCRVRAEEAVQAENPMALSPDKSA